MHQFGARVWRSGTVYTYVRVKGHIESTILQCVLRTDLHQEIIVWRQNLKCNGRIYNKNPVKIQRKKLQIFESEKRSLKVKMYNSTFGGI